MNTHDTLAVDLLNWFGARRFNARDYYKAYHAGSRNDFPSMAERVDIRASLNAASVIVEWSPGPRGGEGWRLSRGGEQLALSLRQTAAARSDQHQAA